MRTGRFQLANALAVLLLVGCVSAPAVARPGAAQGQAKHDPGEKPRIEAEKKQNRDKHPMPGMPAHWIERLREMPPKEQERFMNNNERFQQLPPERQAQIRNRLQQWNSLTPEQRTEVRKREGVWRQMSPEQQRYIREDLLPKWKQLPPERRQAILRRLSALRNLSESERAAKLNDPAFLQGLNPEDRGMLRELAGLRVGTPPEPPQENP